MNATKENLNLYTKHAIHVALGTFTSQPMKLAYHTGGVLPRAVSSEISDMSNEVYQFSCSTSDEKVYNHIIYFVDMPRDFLPFSATSPAATRWLGPPCSETLVDRLEGLL